MYILGKCPDGIGISMAVWSELDSNTGIQEDDIWISGEVDDFVQEYEAGQRDFEIFSIADGVEVLRKRHADYGCYKRVYPSCSRPIVQW